MGSFGDRLRREREQRGISLDDVALTTKIRAGLLKALEDEKFDQLPGGIFNKGFVRAYARHLGIDEEQAVADYLVAAGEAPTPRRPGEGGVRAETAEPRIQLVREEREVRPASGLPRGLFAGFLVLVVVGLAAWFYYHRDRGEGEPARAVSGPSTTPPTPEAGTTNPATAVSPAPDSNPSPPANVAGAGAANPSPSGTFTVKLTADEDCWMQITADGKKEEVTLGAANEKVISAKQKIVIRAGSVGALSITFEGKRLPTQGEYGEVKILTFGPEGLESATSPNQASAPAASVGNPQ